MSNECGERDNRESPDIESRASSLEDLPYVIFLRESIVARGTLLEIIPSAKHAFDNDPSTPLVIFNNQTGRFIDLDLNGSASLPATFQKGQYALANLTYYPVKELMTSVELQ